MDQSGPVSGRETEDLFLRREAGSQRAGQGARTPRSCARRTLATPACHTVPCLRAPRERDRRLSSVHSRTQRSCVLVEQEGLVRRSSGSLLRSSGRRPVQVQEVCLPANLAVFAGTCIRGGGTAQALLPGRRTSCTVPCREPLLLAAAQLLRRFTAHRQVPGVLRYSLRVHAPEKSALWLYFRPRRAPPPWPASAGCVCPSSCLHGNPSRFTRGEARSPHPPLASVSLQSTSIPSMPTFTVHLPRETRNQLQAALWGRMFLQSCCHSPALPARTGLRGILYAELVVEWMSASCPPAHHCLCAQVACPSSVCHLSPHAFRCHGC